mgnify:CR=1 FL=1
MGFHSEEVEYNWVNQLNVGAVEPSTLSLNRASIKIYLVSFASRLITKLVFVLIVLPINTDLLSDAKRLDSEIS